MANIKVQQKLGIPEFKKLMEQVKSPEGVMITHNGSNLGKVHNAFNLGNKIDVQVAMGELTVKKPEFKFESVNGIYTLVCRG